MQRAQGITDIGFRVSQRLHFCHLSEKLRTVIAHSPTLFTALQQVCKWAPLEDTILNIWLESYGDRMRICSALAGTTGMAHLEHSQWFQNVFLIHIVRQFAGPNWVPATIAFEARYVPSLETQALWPNTRFLSSQKASWIDVSIAHLSLPNQANEAPPALSERRRTGRQ